MANSIEPVDQSYEHMNIAEKLFHKLSELKQKQPLYRQLPNFIVVAVDDNMHDIWEEVSSQIQNDQTGARIILIPYKVESSHWIGLWILLKKNRQIERAEFVDPVEQSSFNPVMLQRQFAQYYPNHSLRSRTLKKDNNQNRSENLTIENLIELVEQTQFNQNTSSSASSVSEGNISETESYEELEAPRNDRNQRFRANTSREEQNREQGQNEQDSSITEENLRNMCEDLEIMPVCWEKSLNALLFYISLKLCRNTANLDYSIRVPDQINAEIEKEFDYLKKRLEEEEIQSTEIQKLISTCYVNAKSQNWRLARIELLKVLEKVRPLHIQELLRLVKRVDDAATLIEQKEIILFLGGTGSGKSTTIHFLGGSKMIETKEEGMNHIAPTEIKNQDLLPITSSPLARSETRYMTAVRINPDETEAYINEGIILCDTPGFEDTNGPEVDIANGISIVKAIKGCKSVRPVVVFSFKGMGDRFQGLKSLTHVLARLIPGVQNHIGCFSYLFTKYPPNERKTISASLENIRKEMNDLEKSDTSFMHFINDMLRKTKRDARVIDPIHGVPSDILDELMRSRAIEHPEEVFHFSITEKSRAIVQEQGRKHQLSIISATKRFDYLLVKYKLDQLKQLAQLLNHSSHLDQIYHECIQFITKHLSEEYEQGTTILNRCLKNQTIINDQDIKQYQTRINLAKLSEKLNEEHLGKDVVQTSAYIQYLDQQVTMIIKDFQEKEMNYSAMKIAFDKIQLLSKYFAHILSEYESICRHLTDQFNVIINSFENSVHKNEFDKCASELNKLSESLNILQDHLDSKMMKISYEKCKDYFLQYLNDSVDRIDPILRQERMEKNDVDQIKNCFNSLESAMSTYVLHSFIPKDKINLISKDLLSKVSNYFGTIVEKINTLLRDRDENLFQILKSKFEDMNLIRTVPSIQFQTNREYYRTLEKVLAYLKESRNYVEDRLEKFRRHEEDINYTRLAQYLHNLKHAKWIEQYQPNLYIDMMKEIEECFLQHLQRLTRSLIKINLDLNHFQQIENADKIISEVNEIKSLSGVFNGIVEQIDQVNSWFIQTTNKVLDMIKDTYSIDEWRNRGYQSLDFDQIEKAFSYLNICRTLSQSSKLDSDSVLNALKIFIRDFSSFIKDEIQNTFEDIKEYKNKKDLISKARLLSNRLREIWEIKKSYPQIFLSFLDRTIVEYWQKELASFVDDLTEDLELLKKTRRTETVSIKILIIKELRRVDDFVLEGKFADLYQEYNKTFSTQTKGAETSVKEAIDNDDYIRIRSEMNALKSAKEIGEQPLQHAQRLIRDKLDDLMDETKSKAMIGDKIDLKEITSIVDNLERIKQANTVLGEYLQMSDKIQEFTNDVIRVIGKRIERLIEKIKALLISWDFHEAQEEIDLIMQARNILRKDKYCTIDVSDKIDELSQTERDAILKVIYQYERMDINEYGLHPPKSTFEKLKKVQMTNSEYPLALEKLKKTITTKFRAEIGKVAPKIVSDSAGIHTKRLESALEYLPDELRTNLESEFKYTTEESKQVVQTNHKKLVDVFNTGDIKNIRTVLEEYRDSTGMQIFSDRGRDLAIERMKDIASKILDNLSQYDIREALINLKKLNDYQRELNSFVTESTQLNFDVESRVKDTFQKAYSCVLNQFLYGNTSVISNENIHAVERSFFCLIEFMRFRDELTDQFTLTKLMPVNFDQIIEEFYEKFSHYVHQIQTNYENALQELDILSLITILDTISKWTALFTQINQYKSKVNHTHTSVNKLINVLKDLSSYTQMVKSISKQIEELSNELISQSLINENTKMFRQQRNEFYTKLNEKFFILQQAKPLTKYQEMIDIQTIEQNLFQSFESKIDEICQKIETFLQSYVRDSRLPVQEYSNFNSCYNNLLAFNEHIKVIDVRINERIKQIDEKIFSVVQFFVDSAEKSTRVEDVARFLINMKRVSNNIPSFRIQIDHRVDIVLNHHKNSSRSNEMFRRLGTILNADKEGIGQTIISEHKVFQGFSISLFNEKIQRHKIDYVLDKLKPDSLNKDRFQNRYQEFNNLYEVLVEQHLKPAIDLDQFLSDIKVLFGNIKQDSDAVLWDASIRNTIPKIVAYIFALWTLKNASHYFEAFHLADKQNYLLKPHAGQIISIFSMLGICDKQEGLNSNLVQIGTGEGKSVVLAVTASVLALCGFDVWCACYSEQLSARDYTTFQSLFNSLGVLEYIHYGTFNKLSEGIINENGEVRQLVEKYISRNSNIPLSNSQEMKRPKILLVDEVDVFFTREFYGNVYTPSARLRDPEITSLINFIWAHRNEKLNLDKIKRTREYEACAYRFPNWTSLIEEAVKDMLSDIKDFESHDYVVKQDKIGYTEQDDIVFNVNYRYKTLFAYYLENNKGKISQKSLEENISIIVKCGTFSYAAIPLEFKVIMGVTGTLETLNDIEKEIIQKEYKIRKMTIIPSVYGKNNLKFIEKDDLMIENIDDYFNTIKREITDRLEVPHSTDKRAVLVFFESKKRLLEFYHSEPLSSIRDSVAYLTEEELSEEKQHRVRNATISGQITLFTRTFGRGTDFICYDQTVATNGGVHLIQTFLSEDESEEVQIKGRTARQGDKGSYSLILLDQDLEKFHIEKENFQDIREGKPINVRTRSQFRTNAAGKTYRSLHEFLKEKRTELFRIQHETNKKYVEVAAQQHKEAQNFLLDLQSNDIESVRQFLVEKNRGVELAGDWNSRTICLMDATGSMNHLLNNCKATVGTMFERVSAVLNDNNINSDSFQLQFAVYRNYNSRREKILQSSPWETKPDNLRAFVNTIGVEGGWGNEAIEVGLYHANKEHEREAITQVIIIGDAPPNTKEDVKEKRSRRGEHYWKETDLSQATYYEDELAKLISDNIPVHCFYVGQNAESSFKEIAMRTNGKCAKLEINTDQGAEMLTDFVTKEILRNIGGSSKGSDLVAQYERTYARSYT